MAGEALRLATNKIVNTFVATQAALSSRAYDNTVASNAAPYYSTLNNYVFKTPDSEGFYYTNGSPPYFSSSIGAGKYVNFYNPVDYALMGNSLLFPFHPGWLYDQKQKPDTESGYNYTTPNGTLQFRYCFQPPGFSHQGRTIAAWPQVPLLFPDNTYEIFSMCDQSYSLALGAQVGVQGNFVTNAQINLNTTYNVGDAANQHDAEFVSDNMTTAPYWLGLLQTFSLKH